MPKEDADAFLVERAQQGDKTAFDTLVLKYQPKVMKLLLRYTSDSAEIMDLTQETFIKAYRALSHFRGESLFYTWLYRIAVNTAKNNLVLQDRRPPLADISYEEAERQGGRTTLKEIASPERLLMRDEIEAAVFNAVQALPDELRTAIILRELEGMSYDTIAEIMKCPIGTVRSRIFRARELIDNKIRCFFG